MRNLGLLLLPVVLTALLAVSPMRSDTDQVTKSPGPYEDLNAYEVYSAVLSSNGQWQDSKSLLILQNIPPKEWPIGLPQGALQGDAEFTKRFEGIFRSFEQANREPSLLSFCVPEALPNCQRVRVGRSFSSSRAECNQRRMGRVSADLPRLRGLCDPFCCGL